VDIRDIKTEKCGTGWPRVSLLTGGPRCRGFWMTEERGDGGADETATKASGDRPWRLLARRCWLRPGTFFSLASEATALDPEWPTKER
jgi:hypothetical protein